MKRIMIKFPKTARGKIVRKTLDINEEGLEFLKSIGEKVYTNWQGDTIIEYGSYMNVIKQ